MTTIGATAFPYVSIFDPNTIATAVPEVPTLIENVTQSPNRSRVSYSTLNRMREFDETNNRLTSYLDPIEATETGLGSLRGEIAELHRLANEALTLKSTPGGQPAPQPATAVAASPVLARSTVTIGETSLVEGATAGMRFSISADNGEDFLFTFANATTTWGEVVSRLNAAEIGVRARFDRSDGEPRLVLESTNGRTGFRINGATSRQVIDDLIGFVSPYDGAYNAAKFSDGAEASQVVGGLGPQGMTFGSGGSVVTGGQETTIAQGSLIRFIGSDGVPRQWVAQAPSSLRLAMLEINAMRGSVIAEITEAGRLRLRDSQGGDVSIGNATGSFAASGGMAFAREVEPPPQPGLPPDAIAARSSAQISRDTLVSGAGNGMRLSISTDSGANFTYTFGMDGGTTWGQVADALTLADIGIRMRFDENQIGSPRMTIYSVDDRTGFRLDGTSSRQVVDDLFGLASPYDGAFRPDMFADGAEWPLVGVEAKEHGMTFGRGGALRSSGPVQTLSAGSSITFIDGDGIRRHWSASGSNTSPITMIEEIKAMRSGVVAEIGADGSLRLRASDGRKVEIVEATGDFDATDGPLRFVEAVMAPTDPPELTSDERIASIGRVLNNRIAGLGNQLASVVYTNNVMPSEILTSVAILNSATPWDGWAGNPDLITATRDAIGSALAGVDQIIAQLTDRLTILREMESEYRELGSELKNFAIEMLESYLSWDEARSMAEEIREKLTETTATMTSEQARDFLLLLG